MKTHTMRRRAKKRIAENQRIFSRKKLRTHVFFEDEFNEEFLCFFSTDLSASGIFVESAVHLKDRTQLFLKFSLNKGDDPIRVTGEATRFMEPKRGRGRKKKHAHTGMGIRFVGLKPADLEKIEQFVTR